MEENRRKLKVHELELIMFKNFEHWKSDFKGQHVLICGPNTEGKSTVLQAVEGFIAGKLGIPVSIHYGEEKGEVFMQLHDQKENRFSGKITVTKDAAGKEKQKLELTSELGFSATQKKQINDFLGNDRFLFNPDRFILNQENATGKKKNLKEVIQPIVGRDFTGIDEQIAEKMTERKGLAARVKELGNTFKTQGIQPTDLENIEDPADVSEIMAKLQTAQQQASQLGPLRSIIATSDTIEEELMDKKAVVLNRIKEAQQAARERLAGTIAAHEEELKRMKQELKEMNSEKARLATLEATEPPSEGTMYLKESLSEAQDNITAHKVKVQEAKDTLAGESVETLDAEMLQEKYEKAVARNTRIQLLKSFKPQYEEMEKAEGKAEVLTEEIEKLRQKKIEDLKSISKDALPPMFTLGLEDGGHNIELFYTEDGKTLPFHPGCVPESRLRIAAIVLGMKRLENTAFRVITLPRAEALTKDSFQMILDMCNENGFQLIAEKVEERKDIGVRFVVDADDFYPPAE